MARNHARFMLDTLAPDLRASGHNETAKDVTTCARFMLAGKKNRSYAKWLKSTLIPDLRASGRKSTARDLAVCARAIGGK